MQHQSESQTTTTTSPSGEEQSRLPGNTRYALVSKGESPSTAEWMSSEKARELLLSKEKIEAIPFLTRLYAECPVCGTVFWKSPHKFHAAKKACEELRHTCSNACSQKLKSLMNSVELSCAECGTKFRRAKAAHQRRVAQGQPEFCSKACYGKHRSKTYKGESHHRFTSVTLTCTQCSKEFVRRKSQATSERTTQPFCSRECYYESRRGRSIEHGKRAPRSYPPEFKRLRA